MASNGPARIDAGILHLQETEDEGIPTLKAEISPKAAELLEADTKDVENRIDALMLEEELVISKPDWIQNPISARAEDTIVRCLDKVKSSLLPAIHSGRKGN